ncbi:MAG: alpha/beta fold hydrolase [Oscillospiraceae bacterium]|nr:alpha/beta fold hydrolase [Oscillospiraceae bacterium]
MIKQIKLRTLFIIAGLLISLILSLIIFTGCNSASFHGEELDPDDVDWEHFNDLAETFVFALMDSDYNAAAEMFDRTMTRALGASGLKTLHSDIIERAGVFDSIYHIQNDTAEGYIICDTTMEHEHSGVLMRVVFSADDKIAGLFIRGYPDLYGTENALTEPLQREGFTDYPVIIGEGTEFWLNGILSVPDDMPEKVPAVVIVHGSGPSDMDGVPAAMPNFPNKPYRDIAEHLARNGIAVIRYDKRTKAHGIKMPPDITVWEETIEDAILATKLLKADPRIDENRVFIIGHSLGAMLAPRIHTEGGNFAGLILLAGSPRSLLDIIRDQNIDFVNANLEGDEKESALASLTGEKWNELVVEPIMSMPADEARKTQSSFGVSFYYMQDLLNHPPEDYIKNMTQPFLILQGSADFQITVENDFNLYRKIFEGKTNAEFILYESLNHMFMPSTTATISEYELPSTVDPQVLSDITRRIKDN